MTRPRGDLEGLCPHDCYDGEECTGCDGKKCIGPCWAIDFQDSSWEHVHEADDRSVRFTSRQVGGSAVIRKGDDDA